MTDGDIAWAVGPQEVPTLAPGRWRRVKRSEKNPGVNCSGLPFLSVGHMHQHIAKKSSFVQVQLKTLKKAIV